MELRLLLLQSRFRKFWMQIGLASEPKGTFFLWLLCIALYIYLSVKLQQYKTKLNYINTILFSSTPAAKMHCTRTKINRK